MKPTLTHKPNYSYQNMLIKFANGAPLTCDQVNFLYENENSLSGPELDPLIKYYLKEYYEKHGHDHSFLLPGEILNLEAVERLKNRLKILFLQKGNKQKVNLTFTPAQFLQFRSILSKQLFFYNGNLLLSDIPYLLRGVPQLVFFQWGHLFLVARYIIVPQERGLRSHVYLHFEDMEMRNLEECVKEYVHTYKDELNKELAKTPKIEPTPPQQSMFKIPRLTLTPFKNSSDENK